MTPKKPTLQDAVSRFGLSAKAKLSNPFAVGAPEDQLRAPFERLLMDIAACTGYAAGTVVAVGETALTALRTRPDYAVTLHGALVGFVEIKAPGKGADPRRLKGAHDKAQWARPQSLPNDQIQPPLKAVGCNARLGAGMDGCAASNATRGRRPCCLTHALHYQTHSGTRLLDERKRLFFLRP